MSSILSYFRRQNRALQARFSTSKHTKQTEEKRCTTNERQEKSGRKKQKRRDTTPTLCEFARTAGKRVSPSTADNYLTAARSFIRFRGGTDVPLSTLKADTVRAYERWLAEQGVCPNTSSCYMRSLRALYNKASNKRTAKAHAPFKHVFTGNEHTTKRSIEIEDIRKLQTTDAIAASRNRRHSKGQEASQLKLARNLFLFSFYAMGIPFADMAHLRRSQIKDNVLTYRRRKTGKVVRVCLEPCMLNILAQYNNKQTDYLFPILYKMSNGKMQPVPYATALSRYNRLLKVLARQAGIKKNLTSYVARHSWASIAYGNNVDLPVISKALGHTNTQTTLVYIAEIKDERLAIANRKLIEGISSAPLGKR